MRAQIIADDRRRPRTLAAGLAAGRAAQGAAGRARACGASTSRSASARTRRSSPRRPMLAAVGTGVPVGVPRPRPGTTRSPRSCWSSRPPGGSSAPRSATTSTCATSRAAPRCCCRRPRTTTPRAPLGPLLRLFDDSFDLDAVRAMTVRLEVDGDDGFHLDGGLGDDPDQPRPGGAGRAADRRAPPVPDGAVLMLGTMFAPVEDRDVAGRASPTGAATSCGSPRRRSARLVNRVRARRASASRGRSGIRALMSNLADRRDCCESRRT